MIVAIHQPNYLPWLGYFHKIARADVFVFLDDVQFSKGSYTNRVQILSPGGAKWLTVPIRVRLGDAIRDVGFGKQGFMAGHLVGHGSAALVTRFGKQGFMAGHLDTLRGMYHLAPAFKAVWAEVREMLSGAAGDNLAALNMYLVETLAVRLGFACRFARSSELELTSASDDRLIEITSTVAPGGTYLSGKGGAKYQDPEKFRAAGLGFAYAGFVHPAYQQSAQPGLAAFVPGLSLLDAVFHRGWDEAAALARGDAA